MKLEEYQEYIDTLQGKTGLDAFAEKIAGDSEDPQMQMQNAVLDTMSTRGAAKMFGVSHSTIARKVRKPAYVEGYDGKKRLNQKIAGLPEVRNVLILELHAEGRSVRNIAAAVRCSVGTAHRVIRTMRLV
ncbi:hypothetical protein [[Micrococcus luteus] ATCC 49442]|uniref:hypothetical protein n=1 Tax=[Micrococcus luteus] ATCC 49442 TaxID=2698727 RepID=UPI0013D9E288|nr:hypothetical protein [[Micrococcus luteus] ATCC 49442]